MANITARTDYHFATLTAEQVFEAWTDPDKVRQWMARNFSKRGVSFKLTQIESDPRVGGRYLFAGIQDGEQSDSWGEYKVVDPGRKLTFSWFVEPQEEAEDNSTVTLELSPAGAGCQATLSHQMSDAWADYAERTAKAWHGMLRSIDETFS